MIFGIGEGENKMLQIKKLQPSMLIGLIEKIDSEFFHPEFPVEDEMGFTWTWDDYYGLWYGRHLAAVGFLRGWDDKWDDTCLGVAVMPEYRQKGFAEILPVH